MLYIHYSDLLYWTLLMWETFRHTEIIVKILIVQKKSIHHYL